MRQVNKLLIKCPLTETTRFTDKEGMLGKIWGLSLLILGLYVAWQVSEMSDSSIAAITKIGIPDPGHSKGADTSDSPAKVPSSKTEANESSTYSAVDVEDPKDLEPKSAEEIHGAITDACEQMNAELKSSDVSTAFKKVIIRIHEKRLQTDVLKSELKNCFQESKDSTTVIEMDVFSSGFAGQAEYQIQLQVSVLDDKTKNKLFEVGRKFETSKRQKKVPSLSTRDPK